MSKSILPFIQEGDLNHQLITESVFQEVGVVSLLIAAMMAYQTMGKPMPEADVSQLLSALHESHPESEEIIDSIWHYYGHVLNSLKEQGL